MKSTLIWTKALVLLAVVVCVFGGTVFGQPWDGNGVEGDPYQIWDACDMQAIGADSNYWDAHFELMADIDLSDFNGLNGNPPFNIIWDFTGVFDGNEHVISNFTWISTYDYGIGLFSCLNSDGAIKNLELANVDVNVFGGNMIAGLAAESGGNISGCSLDGTVRGGESWVGGLVACNEGIITNCHVRGSVSSIGVEYGNRVGGLVGETGVGGEIENCSSNCTVVGDGGLVGGLVGENWSVLSNCSSSGIVTGLGDYEWIGGLVGKNVRPIMNCYSTCSVSGPDGIGGLVGCTFGPIENSYSLGSASGDERVGGLVGRHQNGLISMCYSTGQVSGNSNVGGLIGYRWGKADAAYTKCFWDSDINTDVNGIGNVSDPNVIGKTTAQMQTEGTFTDAGWDFNTPIWKMCDGTDYPKLGWEECPEAATLLDVVSTMLDPNSLKNSNMKNALLNKINAVLQMIDEGQYQEAMSKMESASSEKANRSYEGALNKLENDILAKTDGCAETGQPDKNDWIITCEEQDEVYPLIMETIEYVRSLME